MATFKSGDTVSKIAKGLGLTVTQFMALNPQIKDANKIQAGASYNTPQYSGSGSYTYQNKSYAIGTGPYPSGQVPQTNIFNQQPYQLPQTQPATPPTTSLTQQNDTSGASSSSSNTNYKPNQNQSSGDKSVQNNQNVLQTGTTDQATLDVLHFLGFTDQQIQGMSSGDIANWAMVGTYLKKQYDLGQQQTQINAQTFNDAYKAAVNDPQIAQKYADLATTTAADFSNTLGQISLNAQLTGQQQAIQMIDEQKALKEQEAAAGRAYSGFRQQAQSKLDTSQQGIITSTRSQIAQQLRQAASGAEKLYGSGYSPLSQASTQYINPLTGQSETISYQPYGGLSGTVGQQKEQDILNRQQEIFKTMQTPVATK